MTNFHALFNDSFERTVRLQYDVFFQHFYDYFIASHPEVAAQFSHSSLHRQQAMLEDSLLAMLDFAHNRFASAALEHLAAIHHQRHIPPILYELWLQAIEQTLAVLDPLHTPAHALAWRITLAPGITYMCEAHKLPTSSIS